MHLQILASILQNPSSKGSILEFLPLEIGMRIQDELTGNDLIMLALTSKTMTARVEACTTRKIANVTHYIPSQRDPSAKLTKASTDDDWRRLGFLRSPVTIHRWGWRAQQWDAASEQQTDLRERVQAHLGLRKNTFCWRCRKFRPVKKQFWRQLIEYENPGLTKGPSKTRKKITAILERWAKADSISGMDCPAHSLLQEHRGKRHLRV